MFFGGGGPEGVFDSELSFLFQSSRSFIIVNCAHPITEIFIQIYDYLLQFLSFFYFVLFF